MKPVSILIRGPSSAVFDFVDDVEFFSLVNPTAVEHREIEFLDGGGHNCVTVMPYCGSLLTITSTCVEFTAPHRTVHRIVLEDGGSWVQTMNFVDVPRGTKLASELEVITSTKVVPGRAAQKVMLRGICRAFERHHRGA